jgi:hypothetical protein
MVDAEEELEGLLAKGCEVLEAGGACGPEVG